MVRFDYGKLVDLAKEAKNAASEANDYASDLDKKIKNKLSNYSGKHTSNINTAYDKVRLKANQLRQKANTLNSYATKVDSFRNTVISAENKLTNRISSLMGSFKKRWNIKDPSFLERAAEWFCDLIGLGDVFDTIRGWIKGLKAFVKHIFDEISDWYHFKGGAELIDAIVAIVTTILIIVIDIVLIIVTDGAWIAVLLACAAAAVAMYNAYGKISQYMETFRQDNILHKSANNKIASETDFASWLRRQGQYEAAATFEVIELVVAVANLLYNIGSFFKNIHNVIKTSTGSFFQNVAKSMKQGWTKYFKNDFKGHLKRTKDFIKIINGTYSMIRTNNFGKTRGQAFIDTVKAGKDTWDTLFKIAFDNVWTFEYFDGTVDPDTQIEGTGIQSMRDIFTSYVKDGVSAYNKYYSYKNHKSLNLNNFTYDAKIGKQSDKTWKGWTAIGSPSKIVSTVGEWLGVNNITTPVPINTGFGMWYGSHHPALGMPVFPAAAFR